MLTEVFNKLMCGAFSKHDWRLLIYETRRSDHQGYQRTCNACGIRYLLMESYGGAISWERTILDRIQENTRVDDDGVETTYYMYT